MADSLLRVEAGDDKGFGDQVACPALVPLLAFLVGLDDAISLGLPANRGDEITIVLHRFRASSP